MMRKILFLAIFSVVGALSLFSCGGSSKSAEDARREADSLKISTAEGQRDSLMTLIGEISENLEEVTRLENAASSGSFDNDTPQKKEEIFNNIEALRTELALRRKKLGGLEEKMKQCGHYSDELRSTIESQRKLIEAHDERIARVQSQLADANAQIERLSSNVDSLNRVAGTVAAEKLAAEQRSEAIGNELNACYYAIGTSSELKAHNVLEKKFLGKTKVLEADFDRSYFTKADKRTLRELHTHSAKVRILTKQPVGSYEIVESDGNKVILITNPTLFWEKSDFLVVETK